VGERDIHCEVAATVDTLRQLALVSGALVVVMGVGSSGTAHLARLLVIDEMQGGRPGCLHIAPMLAFNLGLRPCITPLLSPGHTPAGAGLEGVEVSAAVGGPSGDAPSAHIQMSQPIGRALRIPLASRVTAAQASPPHASCYPLPFFIFPLELRYRATVRKVWCLRLRWM
jgi:hypothetical protein